MPSFLLALILAQGPPSVPSPPSVPTMEKYPRYACQKSPCVVFVRCPPRSIAGASVYHEPDGFTDTSGAAIIVSPDGVHRIDLPASASNEAIMAALRSDGPRAGTAQVTGTWQPAGWGVSRQASPFDAPAVIADGDNMFRRLRNDDLRATLASMVRYEPARFTQRVFNRTETKPVDRNTLEAKWRVPGGLTNAHGWSSVLYKYIPKGGEVWRGDIQVFANNYWMTIDGQLVLGEDGKAKKSYQTETAWQRRYPDGTVFADVLANSDNEIFAVRFAEKVDGAWDRYTPYKNRRAEPLGYVQPSSKQCVECHSQAGTGGYGDAWIPGGDTVISEPFAQFERGR